MCALASPPPPPLPLSPPVPAQVNELQQVAALPFKLKFNDQLVKNKYADLTLGGSQRVMMIQKIATMIIKWICLARAGVDHVIKYSPIPASTGHVTWPGDGYCTMISLSSNKENYILCCYSCVIGSVNRGECRYVYGTIINKLVSSPGLVVFPPLLLMPESAFGSQADIAACYAEIFPGQPP